MQIYLAMIVSIGLCYSYPGSQDESRVGLDGGGISSNAGDLLPVTEVPPFNSPAAKVRIELFNNRIKTRIAETKYNYPLLQFDAITAITGCDYLLDESPNLHSSNAITQIPGDFYSPLGVVEFFKDIGLFMSNNSMFLPLISPNISPDRVIQDVIVREIVQDLERGFLPVFTLDCLNVTHTPPHYTSDARKQAGMNLQKLGEKLQEYPTKFLLLDWWQRKEPFNY